MDSEVPLFIAARDGDLDQIALLLKQRADPNVVDILGETPLFEAAAAGNASMAAMLLLARADPHIASTAGSRAKDMAESGTPVRQILEAFAEGNSHVAEQSAKSLLRPSVAQDLLASLRSSPQAQEPPIIEEPPLVVAAQKGRIGEVERLLQKKADPNSLDLLGETALFEASASGSMRMAAALLLARADPSLRSSTQQYTARDLAAEKPMRVMLQLAEGGAVGRRGDLAGLVMRALDDDLKRPMTEFLNSCAPSSASNASASPTASSAMKTATTKSVSVSAAKKSMESVESTSDDDLPPLIDNSQQNRKKPAEESRVPAAKSMEDLDSDSNDELPPLIDIPKRPGTGAAPKAAQKVLTEVTPKATTMPAPKAAAPNGLGLKRGLLGGGFSGTPAQSLSAHKPQSQNQSQGYAPSGENAATRPLGGLLGRASYEDDSDLSDDSDLADILADMKSKEPPPPEPVVDVELKCRKAVGDTEVFISCKSDNTFDDVKRMLVEKLGRPEMLSKIWLVHKSPSGVYMSFKDTDAVGATREILFLAPGTDD